MQRHRSPWHPQVGRAHHKPAGPSALPVARTAQCSIRLAPPGDFGVAFTNNLLLRAISIHHAALENCRPPNAGASAGRVFDLGADDTKPLLLECRSEFGCVHRWSLHRRRESGGHSEVLSEDTVGKRPRYYLQNFHFQSGGWMTEESARRYDTQVEVLFNGTANAKRRQALPQLHEVIAGRDQRKLRLLDIGCGTGRFLDIVKQVWPRLPSQGLDLSEPYIRHAKRYVSRWSRINLLVGNAESIPAPDASFDVVTSIFMFHELPPEVRRTILGECARVLKPRGRFVLVDSLQRGDEPDYDGLLELFP
jgi:ubiquinone/menaquinone biosynthesis C-methylase UbiE